MKPRRWALFFFLRMFQANVIVIVIDHIVILFIRNHNRACVLFVMGAIA